MDIFHTLTNPPSSPSRPPIRVIDMHTTCEPTRIILSGFPILSGSLLSQRQQYKTQHDHYRRTTILEPRGHSAMYGALLIRSSEHVDSGAAHIACLFLHNEGYSDMCGHASIALGRFLADTWDLDIFPGREELVVADGGDGWRVEVRVHVPCGILRISVPVIAQDGRRSDERRKVRILSVPSFTGAVGVDVWVPEERRWRELRERGRDSVKVDVAYGGAWACMVDVRELGITKGLRGWDLDLFDGITTVIKELVGKGEEMTRQISVPEGMEYNLYGVMVVDREFTAEVEDAEGSESGLYFFADQQVDRSPTGGAVAARMALAHTKGERKLGQRWAFNSYVSAACGGRGAFVGANVEEVDIEGGSGTSAKGVIVQIEGEAYYTGAATFTVEESDPIQQGFSTREAQRV